MSPDANTASIINTAIGALPGIIALIKGERAASGQPVPTDEEVLAALQSAVASSIAKDDAWLAAHPPSDQT